MSVVGVVVVVVGSLETDILQLLRSVIILTLCWPDCRRSLSPPAPRPEREMTDREKFY